MWTLERCSSTARQVRRLQRIVQRDRGMGVGAGIDGDAAGLLARLVDPADEFALDVALAEVDGKAEGRRMLAAARLDVLQRGRAIDGGLAKTQHVQVRSVQYIDRLHRAPAIPLGIAPLIGGIVRQLEAAASRSQQSLQPPPARPPRSRPSGRPPAGSRAMRWVSMMKAGVPLIASDWASAWLSASHLRHLGRVHVGLELLEVEALGLGDLVHHLPGHLAFMAEQGRVQFPVLALLLGGDGRLGGIVRIAAEDREFLQHHAQVLVLLDEAHHLRKALLAPAAVVVEELDHGDVAIGVAGHIVMRRAEDGIGIGLQRLARAVSASACFCLASSARLTSSRISGFSSRYWRTISPISFFWASVKLVSADGRQA